MVGVYATLLSFRSRARLSGGNLPIVFWVTSVCFFCFVNFTLLLYFSFTRALWSRLFFESGLHVSRTSGPRIVTTPISICLFMGQFPNLGKFLFISSRWYEYLAAMCGGIFVCLTFAFMRLLFFFSHVFDFFMSVWNSPIDSFRASLTWYYYFWFGVVACSATLSLYLRF